MKTSKTPMCSHLKFLPKLVYDFFSQELEGIRHLKDKLTCSVAFLDVQLCILIHLN